jgi:hypothetical protein
MRAERRTTPGTAANRGNCATVAPGRCTNYSGSRSNHSAYPHDRSVRRPNRPETRVSRLESAAMQPRTRFLIAVWKIRTTLQPLENNRYGMPLIAEIPPPILDTPPSHHPSRIAHFRSGPRATLPALPAPLATSYYSLITLFKSRNGGRGRGSHGPEIRSRRMPPVGFGVGLASTSG